MLTFLSEYAHLKIYKKRGGKSVCDFPPLDMFIYLKLAISKKKKVLENLSQQVQ